MSERPLPVYVDTRRVFVQGDAIAGSLPVAALERFAVALASSEGDVGVELNFHQDDYGQRLIQGSLLARVQVNCQRCLEAFEIELADEIQLALVSDEQAAEGLDAGLEPWVSQDQKLNLASLVEEQLILCMPIVNYHPQGNCLEQMQFASETDRDIGQSPSDNPFSVLKELKK